MEELSIRLYFMPSKMKDQVPFLLQVANYYGMRGIAISTVRFNPRSMDIVFTSPGTAEKRKELAMAYTLEEIREKYSEQWDFNES